MNSASKLFRIPCFGLHLLVAVRHYAKIWQVARSHGSLTERNKGLAPVRDSGSASILIFNQVFDPHLCHLSWLIDQLLRRFSRLKTTISVTIGHTRRGFVAGRLVSVHYLQYCTPVPHPQTLLTRHPFKLTPGPYVAESCHHIMGFPCKDPPWTAEQTGLLLCV
jgi:hypothetical protein